MWMNRLVDVGIEESYFKYTHTPSPSRSIAAKSALEIDTHERRLRIMVLIF
jgi:hypothetical protein